MKQMLPRPRFWADTALQMKTRFSVLGEMMVFLLLYVISAMAQGLLAGLPISVWLFMTQSDLILGSLSGGQSFQTAALRIMERMPDWLVLVLVFASLVFGVAALIYCRKFQKRDLASMGLRGKFLPEFLLGFVLGLGLLLAILGLGAALGGFQLTTEQPDKTRLLLVLAALLGCLTRGIAMELLLRGYFAPSVGGRYSVGAALTLSTLLSIMVEPGGEMLDLTTLNTILLALVLGIWVIKRGNLWGACALHGAWLFASDFLFSFAPAGKHSGIRLWDVDVDAYRPLLSGGSYGPQASLCATLVLLAAVAAVLAMKAKDPASEQPAPPREQAENFL